MFLYFLYLKSLSLKSLSEITRFSGYNLKEDINNQYSSSDNHFFVRNPFQISPFVVNHRAQKEFDHDQNLMQLQLVTHSF